MFVEAGAKAEGTRGGRADAQRELDGAPTDWIEREIGELAAHRVRSSGYPSFTRSSAAAS